MARILLLLLVAFSMNAQARTWGNPEYDNDPGANRNHTFGVYKEVRGYTDPDFNEALKLSSPLTDLKFESYDIAVIINIANGTDSEASAPIRGQTVRVYVKDDFAVKIGDKRLEQTKYDRGTGLLFYWKTSTAKSGKVTPKGYFRPEQFSSDHYSSIYGNSPMPWAVFFNGSIASHGTTKIEHLGEKASMGCARLEPQRARDLFNVIGFAGKDWVDKINTNGTFAYTADGQILQEINYKTLISVR